MHYLLVQDLENLAGESCGLAIVPAGWRHHRRNMDTTVLLLGEQGRINLLQEGQVLALGPGETCLLPAGMTHQGGEACREPSRYFWLHFQTPTKPELMEAAEALRILGNPDIARQRLGNAILLPLHTGATDNALAAGLREDFQELLARSQEGSFTPLAFQYQLKLLLIRFQESLIARFQTRETRENPDNLTGSIIQEVYARLADPDFSVKKLADILGYHPDHLNRHFRRYLGQTLMSWIMDRRIELSLRWLRDTDWPLARLARASGFASYRNFVRQFTASQHRTPSEYRRRYRVLHITN